MDGRTPQTETQTTSHLQSVQERWCRIQERLRKEKQEQEQKRREVRIFCTPREDVMTIIGRRGLRLPHIVFWCASRKKIQENVKHKKKQKKKQKKKKKKRNYN